MKALLALTAAALIASPALAVNNGFETGDTSGWTGTSNTFAAGGYGVFTPTEGSFLGVATGGNGRGAYATLSQSFYLYTGGTISGNFGFQANDYLPFDDDGFVAVNGNNLLSYSVGTVGSFGNSGWQAFSYTATSAGTYTLSFGARNNGDNFSSSGAVLDNVSVAPGVPEAATWAMMIAGFGLVGAAMRRRSAAIA